MMTMAESLERWNSDALKQYVTMLGGDNSITRKGDRIEFICQVMLDKSSLQALWQGMDDIARRAVSTAYHNDGVFDAAAFVAHYGDLPPRPRAENAYGYYYHYREPILFDLFVIDRLIPEDLVTQRFISIFPRMGPGELSSTQYQSRICILVKQLRKYILPDREIRDSILYGRKMLCREVKGDQIADFINSEYEYSS